MQLRAKKYLYDALVAAKAIAEFASGKTYDDYAGDMLLQAAVERKFIIIGEALIQLSKIDLNTAEQLKDFRRIVAFRNVLVHLYADLDQKIVWDVVSMNLTGLIRELEGLLA